MATSGPATVWQNSDGLLVRFGPTEVVPGRVGSYEDHLGGRSVLEAKVGFGTDLPTGDVAIGTTATGQGALLDYNGTFYIPKTAIIESVEIFVVKAMAGGTALYMGLLNSDYTRATGAAGDVSILNGATQSELGTTGRRWRYTISGGFLDGAPGTTTATAGTELGSPPGGITAPVDAAPSIYTTGTFTAGLLQIRVFLTYALRDAERR